MKKQLIALTLMGSSLSAVASTVEPVEAVTEKVAVSTVDYERYVQAGQPLYASCVGCHGVKGEGGVGPQLNAQSAENLEEKLIQYRAGETVGPMTAMMAPMAASLSDEDIKALSHYITTFK